MNSSDERVYGLVADVRAGDRTAFSELLDTYRPLIASQVNRFLSEGDLWDEMYQDASLALYRAALRYRSEQGVTFGAFARVCIGNALVSAYRKLRTVDVVPLEEVMPYMEAEGEDPAGRLIMAEETGDLYRMAIACLSEYELRIFLLYIRGYAPRTIAAEVGRTEKSVSNAIGRMLKKLRGQLK